MVPKGNKEERSEAQFIPSYYLHEWAEARGILQQINLKEGILTFEGFIVQIPSNRSEHLSGLHGLIGQNVSIIRTDSSIRVIIQALAQVTVSGVKLTQTAPNTFLDAQERTETNKARTESKEDS